MQTTNRIGELRRARGLSQADVAAGLPSDISSSTVSRLENGLIPLTWDYMVDIARVLGCEPWDLVGADAIQVSPMERALINSFRSMDDVSREALMQMVRAICRRRPPGPL